MEEEGSRLLIRSRMERKESMATHVVSPAYLKLIRKFPLRPIRSEEVLDRAIAMVDALGSRIKDLTADERDYLDVLADLVEKYETEHYWSATAELTGSGRVRYCVPSGRKTGEGTQ